jgi:hypothetical protein
MTEREAERRDEQRKRALPPQQQRAASIPRRWRRRALADFWGVSDRTIDRMRADGRLEQPIGWLGRTPLWSDEQREAAERGGKAA